MTDGLKTIIFPVHNLAAAKSIFAELVGTRPTMDEPYSVWFDAAGQHIGLDPNGHRKGLTGPVAYWHVPDVRKSVQVLVEAGAQIRQDVRDVGGGRLVADLADADGNPCGLVQPA